MTNDYVDTSPFAGWLQFTVEDSEYRAEYKGCNLWYFYKRLGGAFLYMDALSEMRSATPMDLYDKYCED